jgi:ribosomal protein S18 acetylase RimI-like enzyme
VSELRVAPIARSDLAAVAAIHATAFADSAITAFGQEAVRRYYSWLLEGPHDAKLVGVWQNSRLVGFCAAGVFRGAMNGFLRKHRYYLAWVVATHPRLLGSSLIRDRIRTAARITVRYSRAARRVETIAPSFGVLAIATDPSVRGSGAGRALMGEAEQRARASRFERMVLTVHPSNAHAIEFYERLGWVRSTNENTWSGTMEKRLS